MISDHSYKRSFIFALILHLMLFLFLFVKFSHSVKPVGFNLSNNIINATAISEQDFNRQMKKRVVKRSPVAKLKKVAVKKTMTLKKSKTKLSLALKKNMLKEREKELALLKKERSKRQKELDKQKERELQKTLHEQLVLEKDQLKVDSDQVYNNMMSGVRDEHLALIKHHINSNWNKPSRLNPDEFCRVLIEIAPGGIVIEVKIIAGNGNELLNRSAKAAVLKSSPLPMSPGGLKQLGDNKMELTFRDEGIGNV